MMLLDLILIAAQFLIIKKITASEVWGVHCIQAGRIKAMFCGIVISVALCLAVVAMASLNGGINRSEHIIVFTLLMLYSFIEYQAVQILSHNRIVTRAVK